MNVGGYVDRGADAVSYENVVAVRYSVPLLLLSLLVCLLLIMLLLLRWGRERDNTLIR